MSTMIPIRSGSRSDSASSSVARGLERRFARVAEEKAVTDVEIDEIRAGRHGGT
jgi:hypothetical protein